jgi:CBS-domain-containing membrane protein
VKASDVMSPVAVLRADDPAEYLARTFVRPTLRAVAVISAEGKPLGLVTDEDVLYALLPPYVRDDPVRARVYEKDADWQPGRHLEDKLVGNVVDIRGREQISVGPDAALVEVISVIARTGGPAVLVAEDDLVFGVITVDDLLPALLAWHRHDPDPSRPCSCGCRVSGG